MATLTRIFENCRIPLYHNESLDLDHYYQEPYQDEGDEIRDIDTPFETDTTNKIRSYQKLDAAEIPSLFKYFMDGSRRTYKIGDIVLARGKKIYPVVIAQVRAGCTERDDRHKLHSFEMPDKQIGLQKENLLLLPENSFNESDFQEVKKRIEKSKIARELNLRVVQYLWESSKENVPLNAAIAKANSIMHDHEVALICKLAESKILAPDKMLIVDGPLQFLKQDKGTEEFADYFYNVIGLSKSFDPMLPISDKPRRGQAQIGTELLKLRYGQRTPVFLKVNSRGRRFGCWYLRIREQLRMSNPLQGIVKIEKMATIEDLNRQGLDTNVVDNISMSILKESFPTCYGRDARWPSHLYPVYLTETLIKSTFESDLVFINNFKRDFDS